MAGEVETDSTSVSVANFLMEQSDVETVELSPEPCLPPVECQQADVVLATREQDEVVVHVATEMKGRPRTKRGDVQLGRCGEHAPLLSPGSKGHGNDLGCQLEGTTAQD